MSTQQISGGRLDLSPMESRCDMREATCEKWHASSDMREATSNKRHATSNFQDTLTFLSLHSVIWDSIRLNIFKFWLLLFLTIWASLHEYYLGHSNIPFGGQSRCWHLISHLSQVLFSRLLHVAQPVTSTILVPATSEIHVPTARNIHGTMNSQESRHSLFTRNVYVWSRNNFFQLINPS